MSKNIVLCCDGTGNEIGSTISNVLKLYRILQKNERQRVYYNPGVGTIGQQNAWQRLRQNARGVFGLATGQGLDDDVLRAYVFLCQTFEPGDKVWLFGFSRGAYAMRVLAAFTYVIGLLPKDQLNLAGYAFAAYKRASSQEPRGEAQAASAESAAALTGLDAAWHFSRVAGGYPIPFEFLGLWDTVASVIVPRRDTLIPDLQTLRFTRTNPSVKSVRHAIAIDERRRMFRLNRWVEPQDHRPNPFDRKSIVAQDVKQVWFSGVHADIGGGYPELESALSKFPLHWMVEEAAAKGLLVSRSMLNHLVLGEPRAGSKHTYVPPDAMGQIHNSVTPGWALLEWLPKSARWQEWSDRRGALGWYLPRSEPRLIPEGALIHRSVLERARGNLRYAPINLPHSYRVEELLIPSVAH